MALTSRPGAGAAGPGWGSAVALLLLLRTAGAAEEPPLFQGTATTSACAAAQQRAERLMRDAVSGVAPLPAERARELQEQVQLLQRSAQEPDDASDGECLTTLGQARWLLGDEAGALAALQRAQTAGREDSAVLAPLAWILARRGELQGALDLHQRLLARGHRELHLLRRAGDLYQARLRLREAEAAYEPACLRDPLYGNSRDEAARACLGLAAALVRDGRPAAATRFLRRAEGLTDLDRLLTAGDFLTAAERTFSAALLYRLRALPCQELEALTFYLKAAAQAQALPDPQDPHDPHDPQPAATAQDPQSPQSPQLSSTAARTLASSALTRAAWERLGALRVSIPLLSRCETRYSADPDAPLGSQRDRDGG